MFPKSVWIASNGDVFDHVQDEDEWHKINYKGQFGFTHQNNAKIKLCRSRYNS